MSQLVSTKERVDDLRGLLTKYTNEFGKLLPQHIPAHRFVRIALNEAIATPKLLDCTKQSFVGSLLTFATLGLEPGVAGNGWIIPYGKTATVILGYRGLIQLALRHENVAAIWAQVVYKQDEFEYTDYPQQMRHKRFRGEPSPTPDDLTAVYSVIRTRDGYEHFVVLERHEVLKIKASSAAAAKKDSPWNTWEAEMWKKTAIKRHFKIAPFSIEPLVARATELDDKAEAGLPQHLEVAQVQDDSIDEGADTDGESDAAVREVLD